MAQPGVAPKNTDTSPRREREREKRAKGRNAATEIKGKNDGPAVAAPAAKLVRSWFLAFARGPTRSLVAPLVCSWLLSFARGPSRLVVAPFVRTGSR